MLKKEIRSCNVLTINSGLEFSIVYEDHNLGLAQEGGFITDILEQGANDMNFLVILGDLFG